MKNLDMSWLPDGARGDWRIETKIITEQEAKLSNMRQMFSMGGVGARRAPLRPGPIKMLYRGMSVIMSNTPAEMSENSWPIYEARKIHRQKTTDSVPNPPIYAWVSGLGLGAVTAALINEPCVKEIMVIELSEDVIALVGPHIQKYAEEKGKALWIHQGDVLKYEAKKIPLVHVAWHDIWDDICTDNLAEMTKIKRKFARKVVSQGCWAEANCRYAKRRGY